MKRKVAVLGLAMMTGLPHAVCAKGGGKEAYVPSHSSGGDAGVPHYGIEEVGFPQMKSLSGSDALPQQGSNDVWKLELAPPAAGSRSSDDPLTAKEKRVGVTLKLDF